MSRKHERLKPKPRPENAVILTKKLVAKSQLETAIELWFRQGDPISILVLAFNAHEILQALGKKIGKPSKLKAWLVRMPDSFQARWQYVWNFCKHGWKDIDHKVRHDPRHGEFLINFAGQCYRDVFGKPTPLIFAFDLRFLHEHPEFVNWSATITAIPAAEFFEVCKWSVNMGRAEFLKCCLDLIGEGRLTVS